MRSRQADGALPPGGAARILLDRRGRITHWDAAAATLLGWSAAEACEAGLELILPPEEAGSLRPLLRRALDEGWTQGSRWYRCKDGRRVQAESLLLPLPVDGPGEAEAFLKILRPSRQDPAPAEEGLSAPHLLMMQEAHHRVRNGLQQVQDLLFLQAHGKPPAIAEPLMEASRRITCIAALHERLYRSAAPGEVELGAYLQLLMQDLGATLGLQEKRRRLQTVTEGHLLWPAAEVTDFGLVATELVTNAAKHGGGPILVRLGREGDAALLSVEDEGQGLVGLPTDQAFGLTLLRAVLAARRGSLALEAREPQGLCAKVHMPRAAPRG